MGKMYNLKITVLQRAIFPEMTKPYITNFDRFQKCPCLKEGQVFETNGFLECPPGLCAEAWQAIWPTAFAISRGGTFAPYLNQENVGIACCTDGMRPVTFLIERGSEMAPYLEPVVNPDQSTD